MNEPLADRMAYTLKAICATRISTIQIAGANISLFGYVPSPDFVHSVAKTRDILK
jgi:hypothetical protein